ncbi:MAG TPA: D-alanine--D-alanine ligase family protein [Anaerolineales bacterium]|nr:D-alanine--D-alanine ligase family protein [Anaerolineales bacterium]
MSGKLIVAVLFGGRSGEHEVSLMSARSVLSVLDRDQYEVVQIGISHSGAWMTGQDVIGAFENNSTKGLTEVSLLPDPTRPGLLLHTSGEKEEHIKVDVFLPILHGTFGEDGTIQGLFELADVAYVGANVVSSAVGMDKGIFKSVMIASGIPVVPSVLVSRHQIETDPQSVIAQVEGMAAYPIFCKPANLGSSVGITKCRSRADLLEGLLEAAQYDRRVLVEVAVRQPREIEISVLGNEEVEVSVPGEILPNADFYSYDAKYHSNDSKLIIPAKLSEEQAKLITHYAREAFIAIDGCGMARVDFLIDSISGQIFLNEVNTIPGFTSISMYPKLWQASGLSYPSLIDRLIALAVSRKLERDQLKRTFRRAE